MTTIPGKLVDGLFKRVLVADVTPALRTRLRELGLDLDQPPPPTHPRALWYQAVAATAEALFPQSPEPERLRRLGAHVIRSLQTQQIVKPAWITMARLLGPRRGLKQVMDFTDRSPIKLTITERSKTEFEIALDDPEQPDFLSGLVEATLSALGAKSPQVSLLGPRAGGNAFLASWK